MQKANYCFLFILPVLGCASTQVSNLKDIDKRDLTHICIEHNPKVIVANFEDILVDGLESHNLSTQIYEHSKPLGCVYILKYVAYQKWDFSMVLTKAELRLYKGDQLFRLAEYKLHGGGLLNPTKYKSNVSKINPLINQLLNCSEIKVK